MRYVGNMKKSPADNFSNQSEKAVFPPGSIIPENVKEDAVMYRQNNTVRQQGFQTESRRMEQNQIKSATNQNVGSPERENVMDNSQSMHGFMDYEGMEFPFSSGGVLKRNDSPNSSFVGSVEDPARFSPANGLGGRPVENNNQWGSAWSEQMSQGLNQGSNQMGTMMGRPVRPGPGVGGQMVCGPSVRLSDIMCMYAGKNIVVEFLFGADTYVKKSGILSGAGMNFIILTDENTGHKTVCDLTDMKFVSIESQ